MRRIVYTLLLLLVLPFTTQAQTQYLYRVIDGDTVRYTYTPFQSNSITYSMPFIIT